MSERYKLNGHKPVPVADLLEWAWWIETAERRVAENRVGTYRVSTVFLGLNHNWLPAGKPILFETMVFGPGSLNGETVRYETWEQAKAGHAKMVKRVKAAKA